MFKINKKLQKKANLCLTFFCLCDIMYKNEKWSESNAKKKTRIKCKRKSNTKIY